MSHNQIVFVDNKQHLSDYQIVEHFDLAEEGFAAVVECKDQQDVAEINYDTVENYHENLQIELCWQQDDISTAASDWAGIDDVRSLHDAPSNNGDGAGVTVVVMDSGIASHQTMRRGQIIERHNIVGAGSDDTVGHGTACAGHIARLAPAADLIDLRIFGETGKTTLRTIIRAYEWLLNNTERYDIVNMSWGAAKRVRKLDKLQNRLVEKGVRDTTAAGNTGSRGGSPATAERALALGSCDKNGEMSDFSSYNPGENPEMVLIGENVWLPRAEGTRMGEPINDNWTVASGTSFSAPAAAGLMAKYLSVEKNTDTEELRQAFTETAKDIEGEQRDRFGIAKYMAALEKSEDVDEPSETATATVWEFVGKDSIWVSEDWLETGEYTVDKEKLIDAFDKKE